MSSGTSKTAKNLGWRPQNLSNPGFSEFWWGVGVPPDKKIKASLTYPMSTGRNFDEILRLLDSCQLTAEKQVATPVNWKQGEPVVILPSISDEDAKAKYPEGWDAPLPYLRIVPQPK